MDIETNATADSTLKAAAQALDAAGIAYTTGAYGIRPRVKDAAECAAVDRIVAQHGLRSRVVNGVTWTIRRAGSGG